MKKLLTTFNIIIFICQMLNAQDFGIEFGKCSVEELTMTSYAKDPSAEAVVLYDLGKSYFVLEDGFQLIFERHIKIKILNTAGLKWAQFEIPYYTEFDKAENIYELRANTYNLENGSVRISSFENKNIYNEKINEHWMNKKFALPDVKEGSVIEVEYLITSPYLFNFRSWDFQNKIPVIQSKYTAKMVPFYEYVYIIQGTNKLSDYKSYIDPGVSKHFNAITYQDMIYEFVMKDVPAFKDESYITSMEDYKIKIDFQLSAVHHPEGYTEEIMTTWPKLIEMMIDEETFGKYLKSCQKTAKSIIETMDIGSKSNLEKAEIIDLYVKSNYNWTGFKGKFATQSENSFLKAKKGNSADINLFLAGMLNAAGIEAYPVIISTRDHGIIKYNYPFEQFFNYVIVIAKIDTMMIPMDATTSLADFGVLPPRCLNDKGLIIDEDSPKEAWYPLKSLINSELTYIINLRLNPSKDSILQDIKIESTGYEAYNLRSDFLIDLNDLKESLNIEHLNLTDSVSVNNLKQIENPFEVTLKSSSSVETVENKILINPFGKIAIKENPLKLPFRTYPVDMVYKNQKSFVTEIEIPEGYQLFSKPENLTVDNAEVKIVYTVEQTDNKHLKVIGTYEFKSDIYDITSYFNLKGYFKKIIDKFNEKVVIVKV